MSAGEIAERVIAAQGLTLTPKLRANALNSLLIGLRNKPGIIMHPGRPMRWSLQ